MIDYEALTRRVGTQVMEMMDQSGLRELVEDNNFESVEFGIIGIAVEFKGVKDGVAGTGVLAYCSDERKFISRGLFLAAGEGETMGE